MTAFSTRKKAVFCDVTPRSIQRRNVAKFHIHWCDILRSYTIFVCTVTSLYEFNDCLAREQR
jgi:hypothetical protein